MSAAADTSKKAWTEAEIQSLPKDGYLHEVVDGELIKSPKNDFFHGRICCEPVSFRRSADFQSAVSQVFSLLALMAPNSVDYLDELRHLRWRDGVTCMAAG